MPKIENIPADADPPETVTVKEMEGLIEEAGEEVQRIRSARHKVRQTTPKPKLLEALAETDDEYVAAIARHNQLQKTLSRALGRGSKTVTVGTAFAGSKAGSTKKGDS